MDGKFLQKGPISLSKSGGNLLIYVAGSIGPTDILDDFFKGEKEVRINTIGFRKRKIGPEFISILGYKVSSGTHFRIDISKSDGKVLFYRKGLPRKQALYKHIYDRKPVNIKVDP